MAVTIADKIFGGIFDMVIGQTDARPMKPDPTSSREIMAELGATTENTVFIGDSGVDMQTALNLKVPSIGVLWGFRTEDELKENGALYVAKTPSDITDIINKL